MTTITTRAGKGGALTYEEADANFTNLKTDVESLQGNITAANAAIVSANTAMKGYVDAVTTAWTANAGAQANQIAGANAAIVTANTALKAYTDAQITTTQSWVTGANAAVVTANTALKGYTDDQISSANTALKAYVDAQDSAITTAWTANAAAQASQLAGANAAIVTANTALKNYVDGEITTTQSWVTGANAAIVTANTALKGYVDAQFTALTNGAPAILDTLGEIATSLGNNASLSTTLLNAIAGANAAIVTANTAMKSYVDAGNTTMTSYVGNQVTVANTALKGYVDAQITTTQGQITTANTALKSYVDTQDSAITSAWISNAGVQADAITGLQSNAGAQANQITGANAAIVTANTALKGYTDDQISTANTAMKGYVDAQITTTQSWVTGANASVITANTALKGYTDNQISTANTALKSYVDTQDASITSAWTSNAGVQADAITALQSNAGAQANQIAGANVNIARIDANLGSFQTYANATYLYSNANVASYMPVFGGNILAGNVDIPYTSGTRNRGPLAIGGNLNHYDSGVVASFQGNEATYLYTSLQNTNTGNTAYSSYAVNDATHTYYGELGINSGTYDYAAAGYPNNAFSLPYATFIQSTGANLAVGTYTNHGISFLVNGQTNTADAMTIATTGLVTVTGNLTVGTQATVGNISSTSGYFWANGTAYSTGTTGTTFTGNLLGNTLTDSTNGRILANAYPQQNVTQISTYTQGVAVTTAPSYTGANLNPSNSTIAFVTSANVNFLTSFAAGTRTSIGTNAYLGLTATSANTVMNSSDRVRALAGGLDINLNGKNWGTMNSTAATILPLVVNGQTMNIYGTGNVASATAIANAVTLTPVSGSINGQYITGYNTNLNYASTGGGYTASSIQYARLYSGTVGGVTGNLTVNNAIGLHTISGWVSANVSLVNNAYVVLNEDTRSTITTAGNINIANNATTTGFIKFAVFTVAQITAVTGVAGQQAAVSNGTGKNNGAMAYWDVTNTRWSWVSDDTAVT